MSRIGRKPVTIPAGVTVEVKGNVVKVSGPKGSLEREIASNKITVKTEGGELNVLRADDKKETKAMHGLYRQLIANMVQGVVTPFTRTLIVQGVGYKAAVAGNKLTMNIGFSHPVEFTAPEGITITCPDITTIVVTGISKELVGQTAATIRSKRPVEPYHNYGLHYSDEVLVKKEGKTAGK